MVEPDPATIDSAHPHGRLQQAFTNRTAGLLNVYCTAGYPTIDSTLPVIRALQESGVDIVELGIPYSDPVADGPVIQRSNMRALQNGMSVSVLFEQLAHLRPAIRVPVVLMGYLNPVLQYGFDKFCTDAARVGVDALIIPDLPVDAYEREYAHIVRAARLNFVFLVTPETLPERVRRLDALSSGFLYAVTSSSTTGAEKSRSDVDVYLERLAAMQLSNPILAGFGIKVHDDFALTCRHVRGAVVGSAYINALTEAADVDAVTAAFVRSLRHGSR